MSGPNVFQPAKRSFRPLLMAIVGGPGSGKTFSALRIAHAIGGPIAVIDSGGNVDLYAGVENPDGGVFTFDLHTITESHEAHIWGEAIKASATYTTLIIDVLTPVWTGVGGLLQLLDTKKAVGSKDAWAQTMKRLRRILDIIKSLPCNVICCINCDIVYTTEIGSDGKIYPRRIPGKPKFSDGIEYEFDVVAEMEAGTMTIVKSRYDLQGASVSYVNALFVKLLLRTFTKPESSCEATSSPQIPASPVAPVTSAEMTPAPVPPMTEEAPVMPVETTPAPVVEASVEPQQATVEPQQATVEPQTTPADPALVPSASQDGAALAKDAPPLAAAENPPVPLVTEPPAAIVPAKLEGMITGFEALTLVRALAKRAFRNGLWTEEQLQLELRGMGCQYAGKKLNMAPTMQASALRDLEETLSHPCPYGASGSKGAL